MASSARRSRKAGREAAAQTQIEYALAYELMALKTLLDSGNPDELIIADFYKFAAIYALEAGHAAKASDLIHAALERDVPSPKLRKELEGLLADIAAPSDPESARAPDTNQ